MNVKPGNESFTIAMTAEIKIKNTMKILITKICFFSDISFFIDGLITSRVNVELDVSTKEERVDIEADSTSTMTMAIIMEGSEESMAGMIESYSGFPVSSLYRI